MKRILTIFGLSFFLNWIWEQLHSVLYATYQGGQITEFILLRATLGDAIMITIFTIPFLYFASLRKRAWLIVVLGCVLGVGIERYALATNRWAYNVHMPIIPLLSVGLTPAVQLGILGYTSFILAKRIMKA